MNKDENMSRLQRLMAAELYGTMTSDEGIELGQLLQEDWARQEWDSFHARMDGVDLSEKVVQLLLQEAMESKVHRQKKRRVLQLTVVAACIILLVIVWAYLTKTPQISPK